MNYLTLNFTRMFNICLFICQQHVQQVYIWFSVEVLILASFFQGFTRSYSNWANGNRATTLVDCKLCSIAGDGPLGWFSGNVWEGYDNLCIDVELLLSDQIRILVDVSSKKLTPRLLLQLEYIIELKSIGWSEIRDVIISVSLYQFLTIFFFFPLHTSFYCCVSIMSTGLIHHSGKKIRKIIVWLQILTEILPWK